MKVEPLTVGPIVGATTAASVRLWGRGVVRIEARGGRIRTPFYWPYPHQPAPGIQLEGMLRAGEHTFEIAEVQSTDNFCRADVHPDPVEVAVYGRKGERLGPIKVHPFT